MMWQTFCYVYASFFSDIVCEICSSFVLESCSACIKLLEDVQSNDAGLTI